MNHNPVTASRSEARILTGKNGPGFIRKWGFDIIFAMPLMAYLGIISMLIISLFGAVTMASIKEAFREPALLDAIKLSIISSAISTILAVFIAIPAGYTLSRHRFPGHFIIDTILDLPIVLPPLVMGLCILLFFNSEAGRFIDRNLMTWILVKSGCLFGESFRTWFASLIGWNPNDSLFIYKPLGIILVQFIIGCAFAIRVIKAGFDTFDQKYAEVAMTLGADQSQTFFKVILPNILPALVAGAVICWARIFGLFGPILLVAGTMRSRTEIMPTTIFLETAIGRIEVALVIGGCMILISTLTLIIFKRLGGKGYLW